MRAYFDAFRPASIAVLALGLAAFGHLAGQTPQTTFDILITNARVMDGSGNPWLRADVGIRGERIAAVGRLAGATAPVVIDAKDRLVAPGFIDVHSHASGGLTNPSLRDARALLAQGVTLAVLNPDGGGPTDLKQQGLALEKDGIGINAALVIGHASVRNAAMRRPGGAADPDAGADRAARRDPTPDEITAMRALVKQAVADGAYGLSSGLFYTPGRFSKTEEVIVLAREAGGVYTSHIRDEGTYDVGVVASVDEVIRIAEEAKVRGVVSHMKCLGPDSWGLSKTLIEHIEAARARGLEIFADQYPYEASSTGLSAAVMPGEGGESAKEAMSGTESRKQFLALVRENIRRRGGPRSIVIASGRGAPQMAGKNLEEIAKARGVEPEQAATDIVLAGGASIVSFNMNEDDIERIMRQPWTMGSSDGGLVSPGASQPHPRNNGAFARRIARYVRERQTVTLEHAIRTMTSLPAQVFGFTGRGEIREGAFADIVIFDPARVVDKATYQSPHQMSEGIDWVLVNGKIARRDGEFTGALAGKVLRKGM
ncbi:MAG TPA: amidohydrolase family protein [Vicinamibacterales bacterium]|nr:amidohydrolase family protein [Vicinamibacterales bacterium]